MKKPRLFIFLTIFALLVIVSLEFYAVRRIYFLEMERIQNQYKEIVRNGLDSFEEKQPDFGLQSAYIALDVVSGGFYDYYKSGAVTDTLAFRQILLQRVHNEFQEYQLLESAVGKLLDRHQIDTRFKCHFVFTDFNLETWEDTLVVYHQKDHATWGYKDTLGLSDESIRMGSYRYVSDKFSCQYDFYIDFAEMEKVVFTQLTGVLSFMVLSLLIVGIIFVLTLRNMLEERRLSLLKTDFINNMTHELKTPLSTISIATKSLKSDKILESREKVVNTVRIIDRQNRNLNRQINHLLEVSMWERKQFDLDKRWINLPLLIQDIGDSFEMECKDHQLTLHRDCDIPDNLEVFMDELQMTTAIQNLLKNAVKYNDHDPVIDLSCRVDGQKISIKVKDNGIGMSQEHVKHVFDKFYRVPTGNIHKVKGLGLGLFYVQKIIEAHEGTITLVSKKNKGSVFTIQLPYHGRTKNLAGRG